ncbi:MAG: FAD synthase [Candidatus Doudnabacteria bacterium]|nr:FAD synthase [Candidatus Doudnabacteria bacterium]
MSKKRVLVFGTFDILHPGHIDFLRQAKRYGDFLIVSLAREKNVKRVKGQKPFHSETDRKKLLESLKFVDKVVMGSKDNYLGHIKSLKPDVIVLGYDQKAYTKDLKAKLAGLGLSPRIVRAQSYKSKIYRSRNYR